MFCFGGARVRARWGGVGVGWSTGLTLLGAAQRTPSAEKTETLLGPRRCLGLARPHPPAVESLPPPPRAAT